MAGVVSPYWRQGLKGRQLREAALTVARHIEYAQQLAVERGRPSRLYLDQEGRRYRVELAADGLGQEFLPAPGPTGQFTGLPPGVAIAEVNLSDGLRSVDSLVFAPADRWTVGTIGLADDQGGGAIEIKQGLCNVRVVPVTDGRVRH
jgi:Tfp pilus assembly protein FimT